MEQERLTDWDGRYTAKHPAPRFEDDLRRTMRGTNWHITRIRNGAGHVIRYEIRPNP